MFFFKKRKNLTQPAANAPKPTKQEVSTGAATTRQQSFRHRWKSIFTQTQRLEQAEWTNFYTQLEETLLAADVGGSQAVKLVAALKEKIYTWEHHHKKLPENDERWQLVKELLHQLIPTTPFQLPTSTLPVIALLGINGAGKTTTLAKLAALWKDEYQIVIGACDTFRAAASEQLTHWADVLELPIVKKGHNADSAAVAYDSVQSALAKETKETKARSMVLLDTAGRLHNKDALMNELGKFFRVLRKFEDKITVYKWLVIDVTLGQNILNQVRTFHEKLAIDALLLTKLDAEARGGTILALAADLALPIHYCTFGEQLTDIMRFDKETYINSLFHK